MNSMLKIIDKEKTKKFKAVILVLFLALLFGCCKNNDNVVVINLDEIKDVTTEKFTDLNIVDNRGDTIHFSMIGDIFLGADSNITIINVIKSNIVQLDKDGNFKRYIGRQGSGPGEFNSPWGGIYYNGNHYITDNNGMLIQKYDEDMKYLTSYKARASTYISFINENEIIFINDNNDKYIFSVMDTVGNITRSFGDIKGNEEGVIEKQRRTPMQFVYDTLYKHVFLVSKFAPIIRRFDLDGNLLQKINLKGDIINKLNSVADQARQRSVNNPNSIAGTYYMRNPSILDGHNLLVNVQGFGSLLLEYDDKDIINKKAIKYEIVSEDKMWSHSLTLRDYNNIKLLYDEFYKNLFVSKD